MFFGWQDISDEYLVCFFALIVGEIAEEKIVVQIVQFISFGLAFNRWILLFFSFILILNL